MPLLRMIVRQRSDDLCVAPNGDCHRSIGWLQLLQKRLGRRLCKPQRLTRHAPAPVYPEHDGQRKFPGGKCRDLLRFAVLLDLEILPLQAGDQAAAFGVGDGRIHLNELHPCRELRKRRLLKGFHLFEGRPPETRETQNGCGSVVQSGPEGVYG